MPRSSDTSEKVSAQDDTEDSLIRASMRWFQNNIKALVNMCYRYRWQCHHYVDNNNCHRAVGITCFDCSLIPN